MGRGRGEKRAKAHPAWASKKNMTTLWNDLKYAFRLSGLRVSGNFFKTVKVQAMLGRTLMPEDGWSGQSEVVVLRRRTMLSGK